jgi:Icc-related predicted phosphoesterase
LYLQDQSVSIDGIKIYGAPWVPELATWAHYKSEPSLAEAWALIPDDTDILVTHTPPFEVLDLNSRGRRCGCRLLRSRLDELRPRLHCFGHIHASAGSVELNGTTYINASLANSKYRLVHTPSVFEFWAEG